jgi:hypothetical protein
MRFHLVHVSAAVAAASLVACAGQQLQTGGSVPPATRSTVRPAAPGLTPTPVQVVYWEDSLFVADNSGNSTVKLFADGTWSPNGSFSNGVGQFPRGLWSDQKYLYVANTPGSAANVEEYRPNTPSPFFTYTNGLANEVSNVTTQTLGNVHYVFVTGGRDGFVKQFQRDTNTVIATCYPAPNAFTEGVAVDASGNVFVSYYIASSYAHIVEYAGGLTAFGGCNAIQLGVAFPLAAQPSGMVLDNAGRLVVCDRTGEVDVIDPPYTSISGTLGSGWFTPQFVSISADNQRAYVSDVTLGQVRVLQYPSGTLIHTITTGNGLHEPYGVVPWQNYGF